MRSGMKHSLLRVLMVGVSTMVLASCLPMMTGMGIEVTYIQSAPPPRRVEVLTPIPGPGYAWVEGYWVWSSRTYTWVPGHWERPPKKHVKWHRGRWKRHDRGWYWVPGYWR